MAFRKNAFRPINYWGRSVRFAPSRREASAARADARYYDSNELITYKWDRHFNWFVEGVVEWRSQPKIRGKRAGKQLPNNWDDIRASDFKRKSWKNRQRHQYKTSTDGRYCECCGRYIKIQQSFGDAEGCHIGGEWRNRIRRGGWSSKQHKNVLTKVKFYDKIYRVCKHCLHYWYYFYITRGSNRVIILEQDDE